jgi:hypothetical protein
LGNIADYDLFWRNWRIYTDIFDLLKDRGYLVVIVKNIKKEVKYPLWDSTTSLEEMHAQDEKLDGQVD